MAIVSTNAGGGPSFLQEYSTPAMDVFGLAVEDAWFDNPTQKIYEWGKQKTASGQIIPKDQAEAKAKAAGVKVENLSDQGIKEDALDFLIERQYQRKRRQDALSSGSGAAGIAGGLVGSLVDPINIASAFIPVVGEARYAQLLAKAAGPLGRAGVRVGVGAAEGAVGAAAIEPINFALSQSLGDDYTFAHSLMNIGFGTALGAGLHMGAGAIGDTIKAGRSWKTAEPNGRLGESVNAMSPEIRTEGLKMALAQAVEDRPIHMELQRQRHIEDLQVKLERLDSGLQKAKTMEDLPAIARLEAKRAEISSILNREILGTSNQLPPSIQTPTAKTLDGEYVTRQFPDSPENTITDVIRSDVKSALDNGAEVVFRAPEQSPIRIAKIDENGRVFDAQGVEAGRADAASVKSGTTFEIKESPNSPNLNPFSGPDARSVISPNHVTQTPESRLRLIQDAQTPEGSRFIDDEITNAHLQELEATTPELRVEEANESYNDAVSYLKDISEGEDVAAMPEMKALEDTEVATKEYQKALKAMALCQLKRGAG